MPIFAIYNLYMAMRSEEIARHLVHMSSSNMILYAVLSILVDLKTGFATIWMEGRMLEY